MNPFLMFDVFKLYFLWGSTRTQKNNINKLIKEIFIISIGTLLFHAISISATALYVAPYLQNAIEGAFYSMGLSLVDFGLQDKMVEISFQAGMLLSTVLEIVTVAVAAKFIEERERYKNSILKNAEPVKKWGITLAMLVLLQVGTAFGGIINTITLLQTSKEDRVLLNAKKAELDGYVHNISATIKKIADIESGKYVPTKQELALNSSNKEALITFKNRLKVLNMQLQEAQTAHDTYASKVRDIYAKRHRYTIAENKISTHYKKFVLPVQQKVDEVSAEISKIETAKTSLTLQEYVQRLKERVKALEAKRDALYLQTKQIANKIKHQINIGGAVIAFALFFSLFLVAVQSYLGNLATVAKKKVYSMLDRLDPTTVQRKKAKEATKSSDIDAEIEALKAELGETVVAPAENTEEQEQFERIETGNILDYMREYFAQKGEMPSISQTANALEVSEYAVKEARKELKRTGYYTEENGEIKPTNKF